MSRRVTVAVYGAPWFLARMVTFRSRWPAADRIDISAFTTYGGNTQ